MTTDLIRIDYYDALELEDARASQTQIDSAYAAVTDKYRAKLNLGNPRAEEYLREIDEAYGVLKVPATRAAYDLNGFAGVEALKNKSAATAIPKVRAAPVDNFEPLQFRQINTVRERAALPANTVYFEYVEVSPSPPATDSTPSTEASPPLQPR